MLLSTLTFAQDATEFLEIIVEGREAYMSPQNGLIVFREHAKTDPKAFIVNGDNVKYLETKYHTVKKGQTLSSIAKQHKLSIDELKRQNKLKNSKLSIGQKLKVQKKVSVEILAPKVTSASEERVIARLRPGEVPGMSNRPDVIPPPAQSKPKPVVEEVAETNSVVPNISKSTKPKTYQAKPIETVVETKEDVEDIKETPKVVETVVEVEEVVEDKPEEKPVVEDTVKASETETETTQDDTGSIYTVKKGDTLWRIAKNNNISVADLKRINKLSSNALSIGQKLKLK